MTREEEIINAANELCNSFRGSKTYKLGFEIGAKWADEHPKSPWISVEDDIREDIRGYCNRDCIYCDNGRCDMWDDFAMPEDVNKCDNYTENF